MSFLPYPGEIRLMNNLDKKGVPGKGNEKLFTSLNTLCKHCTDNLFILMLCSMRERCP